MAFPSDLEIARKAELRPLTDVANDAGIPPEHLEPYGAGAAKISLDAIDAMADRPKAAYVVVSAITPTPLGEGKTTTTVGLAQAFKHINKTGNHRGTPTFYGPNLWHQGWRSWRRLQPDCPDGVAEPAPHRRHARGNCGAQHVLGNARRPPFHGNELGLDMNAITWRRVLDVNDRALRNTVVGLGGRLDGVPRQTGFDITAASEVMAALALCTDLLDLRARLGRIVVGYTKEGTPVTAEELKVAGAMAVILMDAIKPNLMQTLEGTPALVHTGPFGNIATGNSSIVADRVGIHTSDFLITEAGFGADMGRRTILYIKCRYSGIAPDAAGTGRHRSRPQGALGQP